MTERLKTRRLYHELDTVVKALEGFMQRVDTEELLDGLLHDRVKSALVLLHTARNTVSAQMQYVNKPKPKAAYRSAETGRFVTAKHALANLATTVRQSLKGRK